MNLRHAAEKAFLLAALRRFVTDARGPAPSMRGLRLGWLARAVERARVGHVLHHVLPPGAAPASWRRRWAVQRQEVFVRNSRGLSAAVKALGVLEAQGVAASACRGAALCATAWPDFSLRRMDDVDALVSPADWDRGMAALERAFGPPVRRLRTQNVWDIEGAHFEFHRSYLTTRRLRHRVDMDFLLEARRPGSTPFGPLTCLETTRELAAVVLHLVGHHGLGHFTPLMDIAVLAQRPDVDWGLLAWWSRRRGFSLMMRFAISFAAQTFQLDIEDRLAALGPPLSRFWRRGFEGQTAWLFGDARMTGLYQARACLLFMSERPADRVRQCLRIISFDALWEALRCMGLPAPSRSGTDKEDASP